MGEWTAKYFVTITETFMQWTIIWNNGYLQFIVLSESLAYEYVLFDVVLTQKWIHKNHLYWFPILSLTICYNDVNPNKYDLVLLTFSILCTLILPELGLPNRSPDIISRSLIKYLPSAKSVKRSLTYRKMINKLCI